MQLACDEDKASSSAEQLDPLNTLARRFSANCRDGSLAHRNSPTYPHLDASNGQTNPRVQAAFLNRFPVLKVISHF